MSKFKKRILVTGIAVMVVAGVVAPGGAQAVTTAELQAQIDALLAQIATLQAQLATVDGGTSTGTITGIPAGHVWNTNLTVGSTGNDVMYLQIYLNSDSATTLASSGAGSPGSETSFFGPITRSGVIKFQDKYAADVLTPVGLTSGTGFFGPSTRSKINSLFTALPPPPVTPTTPTDPATPPVVVVPSTGIFSVSVASNTAAAATVVEGQSAADIGSFTFSNGTANPVKITGLNMRRLGVSNDSTLSNVYLFNGATRVTDSASVSTSIITFNNTGGIVTVPANSAITLSVVADIASSVSGQTMGVGILTADGVTADATVTGVFPLNSNLMTAATATLAGVSFNTTTTPSGTANVDPQDNFTVWQNVVSVTTRKVDMHRIALRQIGSIQSDDLQNFRLYIDGLQVGSTINTIAETTIGDYLTFDLSAAPKTLETGSRTIKVTADIVNGSNRTFSFSLRNTVDAKFIDSEFGEAVKAQANSTTFSARTTGTQTVRTGTVTITKKTDSPSGDIVKDAAAATLGRWEVKAAGEPVKIENFRMSFDVSAGRDGGVAADDITQLRNGQVYANGVQIGSTATLNEDSHTTLAYTEYNFGSSLIVNPGSPVTVEIRADIFDNDATNSVTAADTIQAKIAIGSSNAFGQISASTISTPASAVTANALTVQTGSLTLSKKTSFPNTTYVVEKLNGKLAHFTLNASITETVNLTDITIDYVTGTAANLTNMYITYGTTTSTTKSTISATGNSYAINEALSPGETLDVIVYGDLNSSESSKTVRMDAQVTGVTADSGTTVYGVGTASSRTQGQSITTVTAGTFEAVRHATSPLDGVIAANQTATIGVFNFLASNDNFTISELKFQLGSGASAIASSATLMDGTTPIATRSFDTTGAEANDTAFFTGLSYTVPANTTRLLTVDLALIDPSGDSAGVSGTALQLTLNHMKYQDSQGAETTDTTPGTGNTTPTSNTLIAYRSFPTITADNGAIGSNFSVNGSEKTLYQWKVKANGNAVAVKQFKFSLAWNDDGGASTLELDTFKLFRDGNDITSSVTIRKLVGGSSIEGANGVSETGQTAAGNDTTIVITWDSGLSEGTGVGTDTTYAIKAVPRGFVDDTDDTDSVSLTLIGSESSADVRNYLALLSTNIFALAATAGQTAGTNADFIWTDNSAKLHNELHSASGTADWHNGRLLDDIDLESKGWSL